jgi:hypothetical protein
MPLRAALGIAVVLLSLTALLPRLPPIFGEMVTRTSQLLDTISR